METDITSSKPSLSISAAASSTSDFRAITIADDISESCDNLLANVNWDTVPWIIIEDVDYNVYRSTTVSR